MSKPLGSLSLDVDNQWTYMRTHGDPGWESFPSYLDLLVPHTLELLRDLDLTITFFLVGRDATFSRNVPALRSIADAGHEIGCHTFLHEQWLHRYTMLTFREDLDKAEEAIERATGVLPRGFRGPGFSLTRAAVEELARRGYLYDASTFPTFIGPFSRAYYFRSAELTPAEREERAELFGAFSEGFRRLSPHRLRLSKGELVEIPVTTMPITRMPFHISYVLYISGFSPRAAKHYLRTALRLCRLRGVEPSLLLHPLDFIGGDELDALDFFPAMDLPGSLKRERVREYLSIYQERFQVVSMREHAEATRRAGAPLIEPRFARR